MYAYVAVMSNCSTLNTSGRVVPFALVRSGTPLTTRLSVPPVRLVFVFTFRSYVRVTLGNRKTGTSQHLLSTSGTSSQRPGHALNVRDILNVRDMLSSSQRPRDMLSSSQRPGHALNQSHILGPARYQPMKERLRLPKH